MKISPRYCSHYPVLIRVLGATKGPVLEIGMGLYSTPLLHWVCFDLGRKLVSLEHIEEYYRLNRRFASESHEVKLVKDWNNHDYGKGWEVVFIDNEPKRRVSVIKQVANLANYVILHDTEEPYYHYDEIFPLFKYRHDYTRAVPNTSVLSNINDLAWLKEK
jgi:hypothetical protein